MRSTHKCITACAVLLSFILVISMAGATTDNQSTSVFNADTYQPPELQFDPSQEKVIVNKELSPVVEEDGSDNTIKRTFMKGTASSTIPVGSIIYHSKDGITTVFDQTGKQILTADDSQAEMIQTPVGLIPATHVHTVPSGSDSYAAANATYLVYNNAVIWVTIHEKRDLLENPEGNTSVTESPTFSGKTLNSMSDETPIVNSPVIASAVVNNPGFKSGDSFTAEWTVPPSPSRTGAYSPTYLSLGLDELGTTKVNSNVYREWQKAKSIIEYDYDQNAWYMTTCQFESFDSVNWDMLCNNNWPINSGDKIKGRVEYENLSTTNPPDLHYHIHSYIWDLNTGKGLNGGASYPADTDTITQLNLILQGDLNKLDESSVVGNTTFSPVGFPVLPTTYAATSNSRLPHLRVENLWPDKIVFHTLDAPEPELFTFSITNTDGAINKNTGIWTWNEQARDDITYMTNYFKTDTNWNNVHWDLKFSEEWPQVTKGNFGVNPLPGEHTLNEATLHYHTGHGYSNNEGTYSFLHLLAQDPPLPNIDMSPTEVEGKWGGNNKWVILSSCLVLRDQRWGNAFASSHPTHGIMGYKTESYPRQIFMKTFFEYAKTNSIRDSYLLTVKQLDRDTMVPSPEGKWEHITAAVVFSDETQAFYDYLPGYGSGIQPDANPVDPVWDQWPKKSDGGV